MEKGCVEQAGKRKCGDHTCQQGVTECRILRSGCATIVVDSKLCWNNLLDSRAGSTWPSYGGRLIQVQCR